MKDSKGEGERTKLDRNYMCITIFTPLPMGGGDVGSASTYFILFKESSHTILHTFEEVGPTAT